MIAYIYGRYSQFLTWIGDQMVATEPPKTKAEQILKMMDLIVPGDVICRKYVYYLDSILIPGEFSHSGIVIDSTKMVHSIAEGVQYINPIDFIKDTDGFIICRPDYKTKEDTILSLNRAIWHINNHTQYDFTFNDPSKYYCHEFTCDCLSRAGIIIPVTDKKFGVWPFNFEMKIYLADNIIANTSTIYRFE
jgi:uncharacterized protein YycO